MDNKHTCICRYRDSIRCCYFGILANQLLRQPSHQNMNSRAAPDKKHDGFTLIELIVTVAVAIILLTVGIPSLLSVISSSAITGYMDALHGDLALARSQAIVEKTTVTLCKSAALVACEPAVSWSDGWIVFTNLDADQVVDVDDRIIRVHEALSTGVTLKYNNANNAYLSYGYKGDLDSNNPGTFTFCPSDNDLTLAQGITIAPTGRVRKTSGVLTCP